MYKSLIIAVIAFLAGITAGVAVSFFYGPQVYRALQRGELSFQMPKLFKPKSGQLKDFYLSFENDEELKVLKPDNSVRVAKSTEHATDKEHSLRVEIPSGDGFPGLFWEVYGKDVQNWQGTEDFRLNVFNANEEEIHLQVKFKSGKSYPKKTFDYTVDLQPLALNEIRIPISQIASHCDLTGMSYVKVFVQDPQKDLILFFDSMGTKANHVRGASSSASLLALSINPTKHIHKISPLIYGSNFHPKTEMEMDVAKFARDTGVTNFRFPGGGSEGYHWKLGEFDFSDRYDTAPLAKMENVIKFCHIAGTQLVIQVNVESGTPQEAAEWVAYMNKEGKMRVDYWELGNEVYGDWDKAYMSGDAYAQLVKEYSLAMKAVDPTIKIGADWGGPNYQNFDKTVIQKAADYIDFVSFHWYPNHVNSDHKYEGRTHPLAEEIMANASNVEEIFNRVEKMVSQYAPQRKGKIEVGILEYDGSWDAASSDINFEYKGVMWSLANAIFYADTLGHFARIGIALADQFTFQEVMFGLIRGWDKQAGWGGSRWDAETIRPKALAIKLFTGHFGDVLIESKLEGSPVYIKKKDWRADSYTGEVPYVEAYVSSFSGQNKIAIIITNKHAVQNFKIQIRLKDVVPESEAKLWVLTGESLEAQNDGSPGRVKISEYKVSDVAPSFTYTVPAHSVSAFEIKFN